MRLPLAMILLYGAQAGELHVAARAGDVDAAALAFNHFHVDLHGIAGLERRDCLAEFNNLLCFERFDDVHH